MTATVAFEPGADDPGYDGHASPMRFELVWRLPRRPATVSMARRLLNTALTLMGVSEACRADIALAITEACSNAVCHARGASEYQVRVTTGHDRCVMEVIDCGVGLDHRHLDGAGPAGDLTDAMEHGRGLRLIRACTDTVELRLGHPGGLTIRMSKKLTWTADATIAQPPGT